MEARPSAPPPFLLAPRRPGRSRRAANAWLRAPPLAAFWEHPVKRARPLGLQQHAQESAAKAYVVADTGSNAGTTAEGAAAAGAAEGPRTSMDEEQEEEE